MFCLLQCTFKTVVAQISQKPISRSELEFYLAKSVDASSLNDLCKTSSGFYQNSRVVDISEMNSPDLCVHNGPITNGYVFNVYLDMMRLISNIKPKMITNAITQWELGIGLFI